MTEINGKRNPFRPGAGKYPPVFAGRERDMALLAGYIDNLCLDQDGGAVILYGPRGNGKTALLNHLKRARQADARFIELKLAADGNIDNSALLIALAKSKGGKRIAEMAITFIKNIRVDLGGVGIGRVDIGLDRAAADTSNASFACIAETVAQQSDLPLVLVLDDAQDWQGGGRAPALKAVQSVNADNPKSPILLLIAGTPGTPALMDRGASFMPREPRVPLGLLDDAAARLAVERPLSEHGGIGSDPDAMAMVAADAQNYPYFLQLWGEALWNDCADSGCRHITAAVASGPVKAAIARKREDYYRSRFGELSRSRGLHIAVTAVAEAYQVSANYDNIALEGLVAAALAAANGGNTSEHEDEAKTHLATMVEFGFVWWPAGRPFVAPGIPSLMAYVLKRKPQAYRPMDAATARRRSAEARERESG